jgi:hypothetical protein
MAGLAVIGDFPFLVTVDTETHRVVHNAFRDAHPGHIAMACCAVYLGAEVRSMVESHVRFICPPINSLPGNVFATTVVGQNFFDLRTIRERIDVAVPACPNVGNPGPRTSRHGNVTVRA